MQLDEPAAMLERLTRSLERIADGVESIYDLAVSVVDEKDTDNPRVKVVNK